MTPVSPTPEPRTAVECQHAWSHWSYYTNEDGTFRQGRFCRRCWVRQWSDNTEDAGEGAMRSPEELLRRFVVEGLMWSDGLVLIDCGWLDDFTAEEIAYLRAMWLEVHG